jgi:hypothetical protein
MSRSEGVLAILADKNKREKRAYCDGERSGQIGSRVIIDTSAAIGSFLVSVHPTLSLSPSVIARWDRYRKICRKMKMLIVLRIFAVALLIFTPSFAVMLFAAFVLKSGLWFQVLGFPALLINGLIVYRKPARTIIGQRIRSIAGMK